MSSPGHEPREGPGEVSVLLGVGSNLGDRRRNIERALDLLEARGAGRIVARSKWIETEPVGGPPQGRYLNGAVELRTRLDVRSLLEALHAVEEALGRVRTVRNAPREIDLDILLYGDRILKEPDLEIPHPRLAGRLFALGPVVEIAPDRVHPVTRRTLREELRSLVEAQRGPRAAAALPAEEP
jgi:2-amino-4-hydroxy-6-hydroxymethyldihydropteridine diphosphokinase